MNTPSGNDPSDLAKQRLARACRALDNSVRLRWVLLIFQLLLAAILAIALVDYWLLLPVSLRSVGALALGVLFLFGLGRLVRFFTRPTRLKEGALAIESQRPELGCEVSTAAEYITGSRKIEHEYEPELAAALEARTARNLADVPLSARANLLRFAVMLGLTAVALLVLVLAAPGGLTALERTAMPFSNAHYTTVRVQPGDLEIPVGRSVTVTNTFSGRLPKHARIALRQPQVSQWTDLALSAGTQGVYVDTLTNLQSDFMYRVAGGDALSPEYKISTYVPPTVRAFDIQLKLPEYTKAAPVAQISPNISIVRASTAEIRIHPSVPLKQASLQFSNSGAIPFTSAPDGSWVATVPVTKDADYHTQLIDLKGHTGVSEQPYHIKALPDNPPRVEISDPGKDIRSSSTNKVLVKISVSDDFGVDQIRLVYNKLGGAQQTIQATRDSERKGEVVAKAELDLAAMELKEYELVAYHAEATDNNTLDGPGIGKSKVYFIEITDLEAGKSVAQTPGQKVNLLVIQKQIIADTTAMASDSPANKFKEMGVRQTDAAEFGRMYQEALSGAGDALNEMHSAVTEMELASAQLEKQQRSEAIPHEESALAHLYQVVKLMPELGDLPVAPPTAQKPPPNPKVQVVLDAIKQKKKEQPDNKELQDALEQARDLARAQSGLNNAMSNATDSKRDGQSPGEDQKMASQNQSPGKGQAAGQGEGEGQGEGQGQGQGEGKGKGKGQGKGEGEGQEQAQQAGQGKDEGQKPESPDTQPPSAAPAESPAQIAEKEDQLSKEAATLAERLQRIGGKDKRLGHNAGNAANRAAEKMAAAGKAMTQGRGTAAGEHGFQGELAMRNVVDQLERVVKNKPDPTDIAHEDAPKEYDTLISEYLKKLSHAE
jgi:hypothetical protein